MDEPYLDWSAPVQHFTEIWRLPSKAPGTGTGAARLVAGKYVKPA
jgi:hypothetical protein